MCRQVLQPSKTLVSHTNPKFDNSATQSFRAKCWAGAMMHLALIPRISWQETKLKLN